MNQALIALLPRVGLFLAVGVVIGIALGLNSPALIAAIATVVAGAAGVDDNALS